MRNIRKNILVLLFGIIFVTFASNNTNAEWYDEPNSTDNTEGFKVGELVLAGHDFFGTATEGLGTAVETLFSAFGRPDGYIIGEEASGAIIAGLTYGEGTITTKSFGEEKIYWQGPSIGMDYGGDGSRVMFLIYNMDNISDVHRRFVGTNGTAYVVGGLGGSVYNRGGVTIATIKTGAGLRMGANVGYIKFSENPKWLPF
tara:strand:- start:2605 stop:3204 length:600 start_codon:yes stop_codon:yes gene_type:complete